MRKHAFSTSAHPSATGIGRVSGLIFGHLAWATRKKLAFVTMDPPSMENILKVFIILNTPSSKVTHLRGSNFLGHSRILPYFLMTSS